MQGLDGRDFPPIGKSFDVEFCTVARWEDGQNVEGNLFYDLVTFMKQIGPGRRGGLVTRLEPQGRRSARPYPQCLSDAADQRL